MSITADSLVGSIATEHPLATRVFARHGIDFCCGGGQPLSAACGERGVELGRVLTEIEAELAAHPDVGVRWDEAPVDALIDHILERYHRPLDEELPRLEAMMRKVHRVHGAKDPARFDALLEAVLAVKADIEQHLPKEEQILFPMLRQGRGDMAAGPMHVMELEHDALGGLLRKIRELTDDYTVPEEACNTWRALWVALETLERDTHEHIHLENNVLHPRARG